VAGVCWPFSTRIPACSLDCLHATLLTEQKGSELCCCSCPVRLSCITHTPTRPLLQCSPTCCAICSALRTGASLALVEGGGAPGSGIGPLGLVSCGNHHGKPQERHIYASLLIAPDPHVMSGQINLVKDDCQLVATSTQNSSFSVVMPELAGSCDVLVRLDFIDSPTLTWRTKSGLVALAPNISLAASVMHRSSGVCPLTLTASVRAARPSKVCRQ
jgi:hypothetical protein